VQVQEATRRTDLPVLPEEAELQQVALEHLRKRSRLGLVLLAVVFPAFHVVDRLLTPQHVTELLTIRVCVASLALVGLIVVARAKTRWWLTMWVFLTASVGSVGLAWVAASDGGFTSPFYGGVMIFLFAAAALLPWRPWEAAAYALISVGGWLWLCLGVEGWTLHATMPLATLGFAAIVTVGMTGIQQRARVTEWRLRHGLEVALVAARKQEATEREARLATEAVQERDARLATIGRRVGELAHDLRNMLSATVLYGELARESVSREENPGLHEDVGQMLAGASRAIQALHGVVEHARGPRATRLSNHALAPIVQETLDILTLRADLAEVELVARLDPHLEARVDRVQLQRVLLNLLTNALEVFEEGPHQDRSRRVVVDLEQCDGWVSLVVSDSGPGIAAEVSDRLFDAFVTHGKPHGSGLGLAAVERIVQEHGGRIEVRSHGPLGGAQFTVVLPVDVQDRWHEHSGAFAAIP